MKKNESKLPPRWSQLALGQIVESAQYGLSKKSDPNGNTAILGMKQLVDGQISAEKCSRVQLEVEEQEKYRVRKGDLLFNRTNSLELVGKSAIACSDLDCVFASYLIRFQLNREIVDPEFVGQLFNWYDTFQRLKAFATPGASQVNINPSTLQRLFELSIPPLDQQKKIAETLNTWDEAIDQAQKLIDAKQRRKKALMQQLLTGRTRLPGFSEKWQEHRLGDLFENRVERKREDLPLLSITSDRGVIPRAQLNKKDSSSKDKSKYLRIKPNDIGYNTMRMWQGVSALSDLEGIVSPAYTVCIPGPKILGRYAAHLFKLPPVVNLLWRNSQGLVDDTLSLKYHHFALIKLTIPSVEEQEAIASILDECDREIEILKSVGQAIAHQKRGMMQKLLTGKVRVV